MSDVNAASPGTGSGHAYLNDGAAITAQSMRIVAAETDLSAMPDDMRAMALRLVHSCGMTDIVADLAASRDAAARGRRALEDGAAICCDVQMTAQGIARQRLPAGNEVICKVATPAAAERAARLETTRSWAAVDLWGAAANGAVVAVGNAPTALFRVLELAARGVFRPALVIGMPVGFVGAEESKRALAASGLDHVVIHGRRGGSGMAAAAVNALAGAAA